MWNVRIISSGFKYVKSGLKKAEKKLSGN